MKKLRAWDPVIVISGKYKGTISVIQKFVDDSRVIVKGVNEEKELQKEKDFLKKQCLYIYLILCIM